MRLLLQMERGASALLLPRVPQRIYWESLVSDSRPIQPGDLVQVVHAHCNKSLHWLGYTTVCVAIIPTRPDWQCGGCFGLVPSVTRCVVDARGKYLAYEWLKRIPPLSELEGESFEAYLTVKGLTNEPARVSTILGFLDVECLQVMPTQVLPGIYPALQGQGLVRPSPRRSLLRKGHGSSPRSLLEGETPS